MGGPDFDDLGSHDGPMPQRVRMFLEGLARQPEDAISIVATTEGGDAHVADAHRAARARHKRAPKCRSVRFDEALDIAHIGCSGDVSRDLDAGLNRAQSGLPGGEATSGR